MGNVASVVNMGRTAGGHLIVSSSPDEIAAASRLIVPGVGAFDNGMMLLRERGLIPALNEAALNRRVPVLGICLGLQLFTRGSEEGASPGLGWLAADTVRFDSKPDLRVPHMGWNTLDMVGDGASGDPLFANLPAEPRFYFVHSYYVRCDSERDVIGWTDYGGRFASAARHTNIAGVQFHPEKSHKFGLRLMRNFLGSA